MQSLNHMTSFDFFDNSHKKYEKCEIIRRQTHQMFLVLAIFLKGHLYTSACAFCSGIFCFLKS